MNAHKAPKELPQEISDAWDSFLLRHDNESHSILAKYYAKIVKNIAYSFYQKKPFVLDQDDLIQAGTVGLLQALERYDPKHQQNASFETYAKLRVTGAILDQINELDWTPRSVRKNIRTVIKAEESAANTDEVVAETNMTKRDISMARSQARRTFILPVDQETIRRMETSHPEDMDDRPSDVWWSVMNDLSEEERSVIFLRFYYGETIAHTAKKLNISVNSVTVIQKRAITKLRGILDRD